ncbi:hypothetical protein AAFF_G00268240 [Aldrovandia affinis]|uniref:Uncharacterized protein n=1 Tax=Aldrovandia affinis TaxID=143900 RepID=A0AAD7SS42_9TELE|nr:hypothetical protein AAFF_G00268240 [Aldrovandia affinis]
MGPSSLGINPQYQARSPHQRTKHLCSTGLSQPAKRHHLPQLSLYNNTLLHSVPQSVCRSKLSCPMVTYGFSQWSQTRQTSIAVRLQVTAGLRRSLILIVVSPLSLAERTPLHSREGPSGKTSTVPGTLAPVQLGTALQSRASPTAETPQRARHKLGHARVPVTCAVYSPAAHGRLRRYEALRSSALIGNGRRLG